MLKIAIFTLEQSKKQKKEKNFALKDIFLHDNWR